MRLKIYIFRNLSLVYVSCIYVVPTLNCTGSHVIRLQLSDCGWQTVINIICSTNYKGVNIFPKLVSLLLSVAELS